jgi:GNAT superfamily N-acetyltransferase
MKIKILTADYAIGAFDCGDDDLNDFLMNDAKLFAEKKIANKYVLEDDECRIVAYYSLLNDKVSKMDATSSAWRKMKKLFPHSKQFSSYPGVKIGRFAVSSDFEGKGVGSKLMTEIKKLLMKENGYSAFRFLTVDAYLSAVPFYEKNGFRMLLGNDPDKHTRAMYFDMMEME